MTTNVIKGFTYQGDHFTWDELTRAYWNDNDRGFWTYFKSCAVPKDVIWDN